MKQLILGEWVAVLDALNSAINTEQFSDINMSRTEENIRSFMMRETRKKVLQIVRRLDKSFHAEIAIARRLDVQSDKTLFPDLVVERNAVGGLKTRKPRSDIGKKRKPRKKKKAVK